MTRRTDGSLGRSAALASALGTAVNGLVRGGSSSARVTLSRGDMALRHSTLLASDGRRYRGLSDLRPVGSRRGMVSRKRSPPGAPPSVDRLVRHSQRSKGLTQGVRGKLRFGRDEPRVCRLVGHRGFRSRVIPMERWRERAACSALWDFRADGRSTSASTGRILDIDRSVQTVLTG